MYIDELINLFYDIIKNKKKIKYGVYNIGSKTISYYSRLLFILKFKKYFKYIKQTKGHAEPIKQNLNLNKIRKLGYIFR